MRAAAIPPAKKHAPMTYANTRLWLAATRYATRAPTKVPSACARKGKTKCFGSNRCIDSLRLWGSDTSTPAGGAMTSAMLTAPPAIRPTTTASTFRRIFIRVNAPCDDAARQTEPARPDGSRPVLVGCHEGEVECAVPTRPDQGR